MIGLLQKGVETVVTSGESVLHRIGTITIVDLLEMA